MTQKYNLRKYERAAQKVLRAVGISPKQLGFLEKLIKLEEDKSCVHEVRIGFAHPQMIQGFKIDGFLTGDIYGRHIDAYLKNLHLLIDINVNSKEFAYKDYVKNYLKKEKINLKPGKSHTKSYTESFRSSKITDKEELRLETWKYSTVAGKLYQKEKVISRWGCKEYKTNPVTFFRPYKGITVSISKNKRDKDGAFPHESMYG